MKLQIYQVLHVASMVLLTAFLFQAFANPDPKNRKKTMMATGIFATLMLIGGFGLVATMKLGFPAWVIIKLVCWLGLVSIPEAAANSAAHGRGHCADSDGDCHRLFPARRRRQLRVAAAGGWRTKLVRFASAT